MTNNSEILNYKVSQALRKLCADCDAGRHHTICPHQKMECWAYEELALKLVEAMNKTAEEYIKKML